MSVDTSNFDFSNNNNAKIDLSGLGNVDTTTFFSNPSLGSFNTTSNSSMPLVNGSDGGEPLMGTAVGTSAANGQLASSGSGTDFSAPVTGNSSFNLSSLLSSLAKNPAALATGAAGIASLLGGNSPQTGGYQGSIPNLIATRMQVPGANQVIPGQANKQYFTDTLYTDPSQQANAQAAIAAQAAAIAQNQMNAPIPTFAMQYQGIPGGQVAGGGLSSLPSNSSFYSNPSILYGTGLGGSGQIATSTGGPGQQGVSTLTQPNTTQLTSQQQAQLLAQQQAQQKAQDAAAAAKAKTTTTTDPILAAYQAGNYTLANQLINQQGLSAQDIVNKYKLNPTDAATVAKNLGYTGNLSNLNYGTSGTTTSTSPALAQQLATAFNNGVNPDVSTLNNLISSNKLTASQLATMFPSNINQILNIAGSEGINVPGASYTPITGSAANTGSKVVNSLMTNNPEFTNGVLTGPSQGSLAKQLQWNANTGNTQGLNALIQANGLNAGQLQSMFPGVDLSQYAAQGVNIPGYTPPTGVASLPSTSTSTPSGVSTAATGPLVGGQTDQAISSSQVPATSGGTAVATTAAPSNANTISSIISSGQASGMDNTAIASQLISAGVPAADVIAVVGPQNADVVNQAYAAAQGGDTTYGAKGGLMDLKYAAGGQTHDQPRYLKGHTDGMADEVPSSIDGIQPAKLSHGEFVVPADVVSHLGNGNSDAGADKLYQMMAKIRKARTGNPKQGKQINPDKYMPGGIVGYASGGAVAFATGGDTTTGIGSANLGTNAAGVQGLGASATNTLSPYVGGYVTNMLGQGQALANAPMPVYQGPLTAGQSALQNQQFAGLSQMAQTGYTPMNYQTQNWSSQGIGSLPDLSTPSETSLVSQAASGQPFTQATGAAAAPSMYGNSPAAQYMNPYLQASLQPQLNALNYQAQQDQQSMLGNLTKQGAFGGSRQGVAQGVAEGNLLTNQANIIGQGYNTAYQNAMNQFNADQARQLQAQQNTEASRQFSANQAQQTLQALGTAGGVQQGIQNAADQAAYAEFQKQQQYPYQQLQFEQSLLQGLPISTAYTTPNTNTISNLSSNIGGLTGLYNALSPVLNSSGTTGGSSSGTTNG